MSNQKKWYNHKLIHACNAQPSLTIKKIRQARLRKKLVPSSVEELCQIAGISQNMLTSLEHGDLNVVSKEKLDFLLSLLEIDSNDFILFTNKNEESKTEFKEKSKPNEFKNSNLSITIQNGLEESIQIKIIQTHGDIRIEIEDCRKPIKDAVWIPPAVRKYDEREEKHKPEVSRRIEL